jgi:hypothetical protein
LSAAFQDSFFVEVKKDSVMPLTPTEVTIPWSHFRSRVMGHFPGAGMQRGVVFCYGLDADKGFVLGINVVLLDTAPTDEWPYDSLSHTTMYKVVEGRMVPISRSNWKTQFGDNYYDQVKVLQKEGTYRDLKECDHLEYLMPWESELMLLGTDNSDVADKAELVVTSVADQVPSPGCHDELRHFVTAHLLGFLTNGAAKADAPFYRRATDLGTPCPPRCGKYVVKPLYSNCALPDHCK